jgi:hypothetical protein
MGTNADDLNYFADGLERAIDRAERELSRPLRMPWLRCTCAVLQAAQLGRVVKEGLVVSAAGVSSARAWVKAGHLTQATLAGQVACRSLRLVGRASRDIARAGWLGLQAGREAWAVPAAPHPTLALAVHRALWAYRCVGHLLREVKP